MFRVVEQVTYSSYNVHLFDDTLHFRAYQLIHRRGDFKRASEARGRLNYTFDHRDETDQPVAEMRLQLEIA